MDVVESQLFIQDPRGREGDREKMGISRLWLYNDGPMRAREKEKATGGNR